MPDGYFDSLPIPRKNVDLTGMQQNIASLQSGLAQEILDRTAADATKANKSTTINGKDLSENRVIYVQDIPSKNLLPNTASTQTINGVTFTVNSDGSISTSGTASADISYTLITLTQAEASQYSGCILSGCPSGGADSSYYFKMQRNGSPWTGYGTDYGNGVTLATIDAQAYIFIGVKSGTNMNGKTFYPMIRLASIEDDSYAPYSKTNVELTHMRLQYKDYTKTNITITSSLYTSVGNLSSEIGLPSGAYVVSYYIRGWTGAPGALSLVSSTDGNTLYVMCSAAGTITSLTVRVFYALL